MPSASAVAWPPLFPVVAEASPPFVAVPWSLACASARPSSFAVLLLVAEPEAVEMAWLPSPSVAAGIRPRIRTSAHRKAVMGPPFFVGIARASAGFARDALAVSAPATREVGSGSGRVQVVLGGRPGSQWESATGTRGVPGVLELDPERRGPSRGSGEIGRKANTPARTRAIVGAGPRLSPPPR